MFTIKFTLGTTSVIIKTNSLDRVLELMRKYRAQKARAYKGSTPLNLHTIRG